MMELVPPVRRPIPKRWCFCLQVCCRLWIDYDDQSRFDTNHTILQNADEVIPIRPEPDEQQIFAHQVRRQPSFKRANTTFKLATGYQLVLTPKRVIPVASRATVDLYKGAVRPSHGR